MFGTVGILDTLVGGALGAGVIMVCPGVLVLAVAFLVFARTG